MSDDDRYHRLLEEIGKMYRAMEAFKAEMATLQLEYWKSAAAAIRVLSDWQARDAETAHTEREHYRRRWDKLHWTAIGLNVLLLLLAIIVTVYLIGRQAGA